MAEKKRKRDYLKNERTADYHHQAQFLTFFQPSHRKDCATPGVEIFQLNSNKYFTLYPNEGRSCTLSS